MIRAEPVPPARDIAATAAFSAYPVMRREGATRHVWRCEDEAAPAAGGCHLRLDDPAAFHAAAAGARCLAPEPKPWGKEEGAMWDPNGNLPRFGRDLPA